MVKIDELINKRMDEQAKIRESLGTGFPIEEDAKLTRLVALELVLDDLRPLLLDHRYTFNDTVPATAEQVALFQIAEYLNEINVQNDELKAILNNLIQEDD